MTKKLEETQETWKVGPAAITKKVLLLSNMLLIYMK